MKLSENQTVDKRDLLVAVLFQSPFLFVSFVARYVHIDSKQSLDGPRQTMEDLTLYRHMLSG